MAKGTAMFYVCKCACVYMCVCVWNHVRACAVARVRLMKVVALANGMCGGGAVLDWGVMLHTYICIRTLNNVEPK